MNEQREVTVRLPFGMWLSVIGMLMVWSFFAGIICTIPAYLLWNWIVPELFGLPKITLFQTFGLLILCRFFVGNWTSKNTK